MWTYEQALAKAKKLKPSADYCIEYENAYMFAADAERYDIGGDGAVFIMKENGQALGSTVYYDTAATDIVQGEFSISEPQSPKRPGIKENVWSRFDDDGWGIYNVQSPE